ncbi:MAG: hypothetical protein WDN06_21200 [Asticcacaulis sp.]
MTDEAGKAAYLKAQKQRNLAIGAGLLVFVILVFFISMARIAQGVKHDREAKASFASSQAADAVSATAASH